MPQNGKLRMKVASIRSVDVKAEYYHPDGTVAKLRAFCSSMYFKRPEKIEWKMTFKEKCVPDIDR